MESQQLKPITILGAGAWGTALALHLADKGQTVRIWSYEIPEIAALLAERSNSRFLPGFSFPDTIHPTANLADAVKEIDDVIVAVPSAGFRETLIMLKPLISPTIRIICASKGLDAETGQLLHEVAIETLGDKRKFAIISGPSFAREVATGQPTAVVVASKDAEFAAEIIERFTTPMFRAYPSDDLAGVEAGSVVKNIIAIAAGIFDGMQFGANARSALITQGMKEVARLANALGGRSETVYGLSGLGDLILTASDDQSRNRRFGIAIGKGQTPEAAEQQIGQVVEGKTNAETLAMLSAKYNLDMPICNAVWNLLQGKMKTQEAIEQMFTGKVQSEAVNS